MRRSIRQLPDGRWWIRWYTPDGRHPFVCVSERPHFTGEVDTYIGELVVAKMAQGKGVGRALVRAAEDWGRARGRKRVVVDTGAANAPARQFYAALGYEEEDITVSRAIV